MSSYPTVTNRPRSNLAFRVAVLGGMAVVLFAVLFFRIWFLQVLSGDEYLAEARDNQTRVVNMAAPRGEILDRDGNLMVGNRSSLVLQLDPRLLPEEADRRRAQVARIAEVAELHPRRLRRMIREQALTLPGSPVTIRRDVEHDLVYFVAENQDMYPSLQVERIFVRQYTDLGRAAAHVVGSVGEITEEELEDPRYRGLGPGELVGKAGIEATYDEYLRGRPGETRVQVDAHGETIGQISETPPVPGGSLRLSIDAGIQESGQAALAERGLPGGFVALDVESGEVLGMASHPTFDPALFTRPITEATYRDLISEDTGSPLLNRVTQGLYPTASTFKPITALAALSAGLIEPGTVIHDGGAITVGNQEFSNAQDAVFGPIDLVDAMRVSSDVYFYLLGRQMDGTEQLQGWARRLGFGEPSGIDLPTDSEGLVPNPEWRNELAAVDDAVEPWTVGHSIQFAIGQGDQQAMPIQLAISYAAIANGGKVVTPQLGRIVEDAAGRVVREFEAEPKRQIDIDPGHAAAIMEGLHQAAQAPGGTAYGSFGGFPIRIAGKTGTAERPPHPDQAWFVALSPYPDPEIVVAFTFEGGGWGAETAAPAALRVLSDHYGEIAEPVDDPGSVLE